MIINVMLCKFAIKLIKTKQLGEHKRLLIGYSLILRVILKNDRIRFSTYSNSLCKWKR